MAKVKKEKKVEPANVAPINNEKKAVVKEAPKTTGFSIGRAHTMKQGARIMVDANGNFGDEGTEYSGVIFLQEGVVYDSKYKKIGEYKYVAPKVDINPDSGKEMKKAVPLDDKGNPKLILNDPDFPYTFTQGGVNGTTYRQHGCVYNFNKQYVGKAE
jgi:hypothetical protein